MPDVQIEHNVVYGMYSGLALLMDVYKPASANGYGIVYTNGSAWHRPMAYDAEQLKEAAGGKRWIDALVAGGYTVFAINHRAAPRFKYPAAVEDAQRAVRFVRYHAGDYGIRSDRIGACGGSSGGHLTLMLGHVFDAGIDDDPDPINRLSSQVQCVVARAPITTLLYMTTVPFVADFMGMLANRDMPEGTLEREAYRFASPIAHVDRWTSVPTLLLHGTEDTVVPFDQSVKMQLAVEDERVPSKLIPIPGAGHAADFPGASEPVPDYLGETVAWFDKYLQHDWRAEQQEQEARITEHLPPVPDELLQALDTQAPS
jgi:acetyl esterase/lipase